jgi:hypothetical protein
MSNYNEDDAELSRKANSQFGAPIFSKIDSNFRLTGDRLQKSDTDKEDDIQGIDARTANYTINNHTRRNKSRYATEIGIRVLRINQHGVHLSEFFHLQKKQNALLFRPFVTEIKQKLHLSHCYILSAEPFFSLAEKHENWKHFNICRSLRNCNCFTASSRDQGYMTMQAGAGVGGEKFYQQEIANIKDHLLLEYHRDPINTTSTSKGKWSGIWFDSDPSLREFLKTKDL